ncbi:bifunctional phosphoribosyl-AMP cyclohydrolase/phosphoribosyl-ATP diphosphatase HisIE [Robertkochia solimangrovi]|uniref:bifunctional phosphoribosyl-AMP cyclohydrolase/phosphoribosyl-ATP diphosphatase HisIE n=1 Tax=Robertkochia solimangrovi TaxID=2213046 RepID=UPI00117E1DEA|nr:bifunctional phosphoribosyl-AMP cyclohydrolase/phosphoribosyl-ATP diphosphatase HisIE [Robertkochia solimangrovi]TRZ45438.1 bifunctional phosphoribosyl-AMP cyclohydrolase/phosphoribosyl-ATP diphosphatase [Robertkochia solimangrovi]
MKIDFEKSKDGLVPAVIQDATTLKVLMLGYMNREAYEKTLEIGKVTFFSRSKGRLWTKGEESGNFLNVSEHKIDCDRDTLLIKVFPVGPVCHTGSDTCWDEENTGSTVFLEELESVIASRKLSADPEKSYVSSLFAKGINKVAQKVGEEAVETVIEAMDNNDELFLNESADLLFHYLILLQAKGYKLKDIVGVLEERHR